MSVALQNKNLARAEDKRHWIAKQSAHGEIKTSRADEMDQYKASKRRDGQPDHEVEADAY